MKGVARKIAEASGNEAIAIPSDVTDESSVQKLVDRVMEKYGKIDILVNAMGLNIKHDAFEYLMEDWDKLFAANVKGTMIACKTVGRVMREQNSGAIVNLSSVRGIRGYTGGNAGYCATKGAVEQITKTLALEWAPHNIRVNALGPALVITPGTKHIAENPETGQKVCLINSLGKNCVARRFGGCGELSGIRCRQFCDRSDDLCGWRADGRMTPLGSGSVVVDPCRKIKTTNQKRGYYDNDD